MLSCAHIHFKSKENFIYFHPPALPWNLNRKRSHQSGSFKIYGLFFHFFFPSQDSASPCKAPFMYGGQKGPQTQRPFRSSCWGSKSQRMPTQGRASPVTASSPRPHTVGTPSSIQSSGREKDLGWRREHTEMSCAKERQKHTVRWRLSTHSEL